MRKTKVLRQGSHSLVAAVVEAVGHAAELAARDALAASSEERR